jgi:hypothetical protein
MGTYAAWEYEQRKQLKAELTRLRAQVAAADVLARACMHEANHDFWRCRVCDEEWPWDCLSSKPTCKLAAYNVLRSTRPPSGGETR